MDGKQQKQQQQQQFDKIQPADQIEENQAAASIQNDSSNDQVNTKSQSVALEELQQQLDRKCKDIERLQQHLIDSEEQHTHELVQQEAMIDQLNSQVAKLSSQLQQLQSQDSTIKVLQLRQEVDDAHQAYDDLDEENKKLLEQINEKSSLIQNLQDTLRALEMTKKKEIEMQSHSLLQQVKVQQQNLQILESELSQCRESMTELRIQTDNSINQQQKEIEQLRSQLTQAQSQSVAPKAMQTLRLMSEGEAINKRLLANLLIKYFSCLMEAETQDVHDRNANSGSKDVEILLLITRVLDMTDGDRVKIGLTQAQNGTWTRRGSIKAQKLTADALLSPTSQQQQSLIDQWITFLDKESQLASPSSSSSGQDSPQEPKQQELQQDKL
ncbi:hypothetical protein MIR68_006781 [Amoeboaphelidium protococcarum]|nr:hypothetical protein MIR68_006781 [Amoeboaphelidium protococcarum]